MIGLVGCLTVGCVVTPCLTQDELVPPPHVRIEKPNAIYLNKISPLYRQFKISPSPILAQKIVTALERLLLDNPTARFVFATNPTGGEPFQPIYAVDNHGGPLSMLSALYQYQGRYDEALAIEVRKALVIMQDVQIADSFATTTSGGGGNLPRELIDVIEVAEKMLAQKRNIHPLVFVNGWCVRTRWKGNNPNDALVSLNDVAYAFHREPFITTLGDEKAQSVIRRDWRAPRFSLSLKDRTLVFQANLKKALVDGKEVALSRQVERAPFDLYVPLGDLLKSLGGTVRPPQKDELKDFQKYFPVSLLVVDLK
jgi:hypothetical protein